MKSYFIFLFLFLTCSKAQVNSFDWEVKELARLSVDAERLNGIRKVLSWDLLETEKTGFEKAYDSISNSFYAGFERYYKNQYASEEIKQLLNFYKTSVGGKLAIDMGKLYQSNLPENEPLQKRLTEIHKTFHKNQKSHGVSVETTEILSIEPDIAKLFKAIGIKEYMEAEKANGIMSTEPQFEADFIETFDKMTTLYLIDLEKYFLSNYTNVEIKELLQFYKTPLGRKVAGNSTKLIKVTFDANEKWIEDIQQIMHDITFGKFQ